MDRKFNLLLIFFITFITFIVLQLSLSKMLFSFKKENNIKQFIQNIKQTKSINPQTFWEFRDLNSNGIFSFLNSESITNHCQDFNDLILPKSILNNYGSLMYLCYQSDILKSVDYLIDVKASKNVFDYFTNDYQNSILKTDDILIFENINSKEIYLIFTKPIPEMEKAKGFFDFVDKDEINVDNKLWLSISKFRLN